MSEVRIHLSREIISDLWRHKLQVVLTLAVLITAFAVILVTNMTRGLTAQQNDLMAEESKCLVMELEKQQTYTAKEITLCKLLQQT